MRDLTMIVAAGLTPAWQQILLFHQLHPGEVNRAQTSVWCGSGKVLNVGAALHHLGAESVTVSPIGGATGQQICDDFAHRGIAARWISTQATTRVCTTLLDQSTGQTTELVENSASLSHAELQAYAETFEEAARAADFVILSGSLPQGTSPTYYRSLLERTNAKAVLDVRGRELTECLPLRPLLVKPNRAELAATVGRPITSDADVIDAMKELRDGGAEWVVVSNGSSALFVLGPSGLQTIQPPRVTPINPIGCGDSLTAAITHEIANHVEPLDAIRVATVYAANKASILRPTFER